MEPGERCLEDVDESMLPVARVGVEDHAVLVIGGHGAGDRIEFCSHEGTLDDAPLAGLEEKSVAAEWLRLLV